MKKTTKITVIFFLALFLVLNITSMTQKSVTADEPFIMSGYAYLKTGNSWNTNHPILLHALNAIPLFFLKTNLPPFDQKHPRDVARSTFLFYYNNNPDQILFWARMVTVILGVILGFYVFKWAKDMYGTKAGALALFFYSLCPNIIAHSQLATTDLGATMFIFITLYYFHKYLNSNSKKYLIATGIFSGLALSSKVTAVYLFPIFLILYLLHKYIIKERRSPLPPKTFFLKSFFIIICLAVFVTALVHSLEIHPIFNTNDPFYSPEWRTPERLEEVVNSILPFKSTALSSIIKFAATKISVPGPHFLQGAYTQFVYNKEGSKAFLMGKVKDGEGWRSYFLIAFLIKTPIPTIILLVATLAITFKMRKKNLMNSLFLLVPILFFFLAFSLGKLNLGLRHILQIYPFLFVFISQAVNIKLKRRNWITFAILMLICLWYLASNMLIYPHYLAYFNEFIGGPSNGHNYLVDSNLDWGQDLKGLKEYIDKQRIKEIRLKYAGYDSPEYRGINYKTLECGKETKGFIAISANYLENIIPKERDCYLWLRKYKPIANMGYSIFIYNIP